MRSLKIALLAGAGTLALATTAQAQIPMPGFYIAGQGTYFINSWKDDFREFAGDTKAGTDNGWKGAAVIGYRFDTPWDIGVGGGLAKLSEGKAVGAFNNRVKANWWYIDGFVGYTFADPTAGVAWRPFIGVRYVNFTHKWTDDVPPIFSGDIDYNGIGPRAGADVAWRFGGSSWFLSAGAAAAVTFGKIKQEGTFPSSKDGRTAINFEGQAGIGYEFAPGVALTVGMQVDYWWNVNFTDAAGNTGKGDRGAWGPFARLAYNFALPPQLAAAPIMPIVQPVQKYVVFFDWDRDNITPQASSTIKQAADAFKAGRNTRVEATGHADRSGSDQYNMGLSLRRANNVKNELIRNGVPAAAIVVVGRGETMPLVQTADGVREPQNRRVEIVLN